MQGGLGLAAPEEEPTLAEPPGDEPEPRSAAPRGAMIWAERHPLLIVGAIASVVAVVHGVWIWNVRHVGGFDPDEASYLASSLQLHRSIDLLHPQAFVDTLMRTSHGITVPLLSVPLLIIGPRDPRSAMMVQPILLVFIAVATAGITLRLTKRSAPAVVAGTCVVLLPTMTTAVQSYWYGLGAAAAMTGAIWALLASERATNRWIWWYGVAIGLMCLTRTMTLGYLPACGVAGLIVAWPERRAIKRVITSFALGLAIAAPWYLANRKQIFGYLFTFGYGDRAAEWGPTGLTDRLNLRYERLADGLGFGWSMPVALLVLLYCAVQLARHRRLPRVQARPLCAVAAVIILGLAALMSTSNNGVWFELPLVVLSVAVIVTAAAQLPKPVGATLAAGVLIGSLVSMPSALWLTRWTPSGSVSHYEWGFSEYDERFRPDTRSAHAQAASEWWDLSSNVEREMRSISGDGGQTVFLMTGNTLLYNANVVQMVSEVEGWDPDVVVPNTTLDPADRADYLGSVDLTRRTGVERVLVVGLHDQIMWPLDAKTLDFLAQAKAAGFVETKRFEMPRGGHVSIFRLEAEP